jgi:hypothetical protein
MTALLCVVLTENPSAIEIVIGSSGLSAGYSPSECILIPPSSPLNRRANTDLRLSDDH